MTSTYDPKKKTVALVLTQREFDILWRASYCYGMHVFLSEGPEFERLHKDMCEASMKSGNAQCFDD